MSCVLLLSCILWILAISKGKKCNGGYIDVTYLEDAVLINLSAIMQRWTGDIYMATVCSSDLRFH